MMKFLVPGAGYIDLSNALLLTQNYMVFAPNITANDERDELDGVNAQIYSRNLFRGDL